MSYEDERGSSGGAIIAIAIAAVLALVVLVGGCAAVGGLLWLKRGKAPPSAAPVVIHERGPEGEQSSNADPSAER